MNDKWDPTDYHRHSYPQHALASGLLKRLPLTGDERILDIGCGDGRVSAELARRVPRGSVLGIDASHNMIEFARTMFPESAYPNLSFVYGDATRLSFCQEFDLVVAFASLHWVGDLGATLQGIRRSLKPGGRFAAQLVATRSASATVKSPLYLARKEVMNRPAWKTYFEGFAPRRTYTADEYNTLLQVAGFTLRRFGFVCEEVVHPSTEALKGYARSTWHRYTDRIPVQERDAFLDEVVQRCVELSSPDSQGKIRLRMHVLEFEATVPNTSARLTAVPEHVDSVFE